MVGRRRPHEGGGLLIQRHRAHGASEAASADDDVEPGDQQKGKDECEDASVAG